MCRVCTYTRTSRGRFICNFTYLYGCRYKCCFTKIILWEPNSEGKTLESQPHQPSPWWWEAVCWLGFGGGSISQSWFSIFEVEDIPPASATCPWPPPPQGLGRGWGPDGSWGPSSILNAASSPPPTTLLHSWSYLHPLTPPPLPRSKPLSPSARQCCMTGQTQPFTKTHPVSLLCRCLGSQENRHDNGESWWAITTKEQLDGGVEDLTWLLICHPTIQSRITANWAAYGWRCSVKPSKTNDHLSGQSAKRINLQVQLGKCCERVCDVTVTRTRFAVQWGDDHSGQSVTEYPLLLSNNFWGFHIINHKYITKRTPDLISSTV